MIDNGDYNRIVSPKNRQKRFYVMAKCSGVYGKGHIVVLTLAGTRGGTRAMEPLTFADARKLRDELTEILEKNDE